MALFALVFPEDLAMQPARVPKMALHLGHVPAWAANVSLVAVLAACLAGVVRWARRAG